MPSSQPSLQDTESFSNLFLRTQLIIFRFIFGLHGGPLEDVEDLTSDTYMRAWKSRSHFFGDDHDALCWLFTIARHLVIDAHRKKKTHPDNSSFETMDDATINSILISTQHSPEEMAVTREQFIHLWIVLQGLPDERREMLVLRYMIGWQVKQIASYLKMEENTVSVYIRRSLEQIHRDWIEI
jgi:RNA polymerase sigma-70 factor (ECF subfamily)